MKFLSLFPLLLLTSCGAFSVRNSAISRRDLLKIAPAVGLPILLPEISWAGIDPNALKGLQIEGDQTGAQARLRQLQGDVEEKPENMDVMFETLASGVSYGEYKAGKGESVVKEGSKVAVEMTIRMKAFATNNEPGGVKYFESKKDTEFNEVAWTVGSGELLPGLEEGMMGMKKGGIRRIEVPSPLVFAARNNKQLPLPSETNKDGKRRFENLFKTDATLLFEVLVIRIK
uniref:peptidylprolyl isomerase n=1 Tax=Fibrocapsa japonica TaxID=94617 RepID=A0A7S2V4T0_9STRA|mmetsp:Transcript_667/g.974  ORF Transcript_667/g.974 Transcript_667/m.974 type:complete len:230 (+) Transcript_667:71-760(+)